MISIPEPLILLAVMGGMLQLAGRSAGLRVALRPVGLSVLLLAAVLQWVQTEFDFSILSTATFGMPDDGPDDITRRLGVWLSLALGGALLLIDSDRDSRVAGPILLAVAAVGTVASCDSVLWLVVGLHVVMLEVSVLIGRVDAGDEISRHRTDLPVFQAVCVALFVFGLGLLFTHTATLSLEMMREQFQSSMGAEQGTRLAVAASVLMGTGLLGLTCSCRLPWEISQQADGARFRSAAAASFVPAIAATLIMLRLFPGLLAAWDADVVTVVAITALLLMGIGVIGVWLQTELRAMLGCAFLIHAGLWFATLGAACWDLNHPKRSLVADSGLPGGHAATLLALACDTAAMAGVWLMLSRLSGDRDTLRHPDELCGLLREQPLVGVGMSVCLLSLCGAPLLAGFWVRFWSITALFGPREVSSLTGLYEPHFGFLFLAVVSAAAQLVLCALYLRLLQRIVLEHPLGRIRSMGRTSARFCGLLLAGAVLVAGVGPAPLLRGVMQENAADEAVPATPVREAPSGEQRSMPAGGVGGQQAASFPMF